MKKALLTLMCLTAMIVVGTSLRAQEVTITLLPGWTWISYPRADTLDIATALGTFTPMEGDMIKTQYGFSNYHDGYWNGSVQHFYPGMGYMYYSTRYVPTTLVFCGSASQPQVFVTTSEPMLITAISAMGGGEVTVSDGTYILVRGLCWATHENPTTNEDSFVEEGSGVGSFTASMTGLNISTTYYYRAYAVTANSTVYGEQQSFTTRDGIPTLTTTDITNITAISATSGGNITDDGGLSVIAYGVCLSTTPNPTIDYDILEANDFENGLIPTNWTNDVIYPWIVSQDTSTGNYCIKSSNSGVPNSTSSIQVMVEFVEGGVVGFDALCQGEGTGQIWDKCIFSIDGEAQFVYGAEVSGWNHYSFIVTAGMHTFEWTYTKDATQNPTGDAFFIDNVVFTDPEDPDVVMVFTGGSGYTGGFSSNITGLEINTTYYVRAYAITSAGKGYGEQVSFTTRNGIPTVTTAIVSNIQGTYAIGGGNILDDGGLAVTARGVCWSTTPNPTLADAHSSNGNGIGSFSSYITGLTMNTTYYVRAYATNSFVTVYGNQLSFTAINNNEYVYVDLGLPSGLLWATCNVGAETPEDYGDYFAWGETQPKNNFSWINYQYCMGSSNTLTKYCNNSSYGYNGFTDNLTTLLPEDDAATANWGDGWRMPTYDNWVELYQNTTVTWTTQNGVNGRLFTASNGNNIFLPAAGYRSRLFTASNGNNIFLPAAGYRGNSSLSYAGSLGYYWSSSLYAGNPVIAWYLYFYSGSYYMNGIDRACGQSVRPVRSASQN